MVFSGHSRIGTLGSCGEAVVVMMLCKLKGIVVCVFSVFLLLVTELAFVSVSVHFVFCSFPFVEGSDWSSSFCFVCLAYIDGI